MTCRSRLKNHFKWSGPAYLPLLIYQKGMNVNVDIIPLSIESLSSTSLYCRCIAWNQNGHRLTLSAISPRLFVVVFYFNTRRLIHLFIHSFRVLFSLVFIFLSFILDIFCVCFCYKARLPPFDSADRTDKWSLCHLVFIISPYMECAIECDWCRLCIYSSWFLAVVVAAVDAWISRVLVCMSSRKAYLGHQSIGNGRLDKSR